MGMFDYYEPSGRLYCPLDHHPLVDWQGKEGPCLLLLWQQGVAAPSHERINEESSLAQAELENIRLPAAFRIYTFDCPVHQPLIATCTTEGGVWRTTAIGKLGVYGRDDDELPDMLTALPVARGNDSERYPKLREFVLIDLTTQMRFLPQFVRGWPRERLLAWLRVWGDVYALRGTAGWPRQDTYTFRSWAGRWTTFVLTEDGGLFLPGTSGWAWPNVAE